MNIKDFKYKINASGYTITGYSGSNLHIVIPEGVTEIEKDCFTGMPIKSITFPNSLVAIKDGAFYYCEDLESVTFAEHGVLEDIDEYAFGCCFSLKKIEIPKSVVYIRLGAFDGCESLTYASLFSCVSVLKAEAFRCCDSLKEITVFGSEVPTTWQTGWHEEGVKINLVDIEQKNKPVEQTIDLVKERKNSCRLDEFIVEEVKSGFKIIAPKNKGIKNLVIPAEVTEIATKAFFECRMLEKVVGHENLSVVGIEAFCECSALSKVYLDESTLVMSGAFKGCVSLESMKITKLMQNAVFANSGLKHLTFCEDIDTIPEFFFYNCPLENVSLPDSVQFIMTGAFANSKIKSINFGKGVSNIWSKAFYKCTMLESVNIPNDVKYVMEQAFCGCYSLTNVNLNNVSEIRSEAFALCANLENITIPKSVVNVHKNAFSAYLKNVTIEGNKQIPESWDKEWMGENLSKVKFNFKN